MDNRSLIQVLPGESGTHSPSLFITEGPEVSHPPAALRRLILIIATMIAATLTSGVITVTTTAHAADHQGGCNSNVNTQGFDLGVCIDDRGTGTTAFPDLYVNAAPQMGLRESCRIDIETWDDRNNKLGDTATDCKVGHHTAAPLTVGSTTRVHAFTRLWFDGSPYATGDSPAVTLSATQELTYQYGYPLAYPPDSRHW